LAVVTAHLLSRGIAPHFFGVLRLTDTIRPGDQVLFLLEDGKTFLVRMESGKRHSTHRGSVDHDDIIGGEWGDVVLSMSGKSLSLLRPRGIDRMMKVQRRTNIMYPKDVAYLIAEMDLQSGDRVVELGCGSGSMTQALARAVSPGGQVISYDRRPEFLELARANCASAGITDVDFRDRQVGDALEPGVDAVFTDIPEPWSEIAVIRDALHGSGRFAAGIPTFNQAEKLATALDHYGFGLIETVELLRRSILARAGKTRPAHRMIGHTQLLTTAVKVNRDEVEIERTGETPEVAETDDE
jgi:tRNA (adenine57-N1/adenine58-N1)-methyltransferase